ncbi:hypothetical protein HLB01_10350 [Bordetella trematum]|uniref:hypothetical protein n=1 Tax=Bordetella trematum TaxID=123899 RepID=UPI000F8E2BB3|nr:hypothetical protein [Bordetella trematum]NNH19425.1 hypothetical protein [Bordetella trematum]
MPWADIPTEAAPGGPAWLQVSLAPGGALVLSGQSLPLPPARALPGLLETLPDLSTLFLLPDQLLLSHQAGDCHVLVRVRASGAGSELGESRLCPGAPVGSLDLGEPARRWQAYAEDGVSLSLWTLPLEIEAAGRWLDERLQALGWQRLDAGAGTGRWQRNTQHLEAFLTSLAQESGMLLLKQGVDD